MKITFYNSLAESTRVDKSDYLTVVRTENFVFKQPTSVLTPFIIVQLTVLDYNFGNYAYIQELNKYYFIVDITSIRAKVWGIQLREDVLMTYEQSLRQLSAYIARQENIYNQYLVDSEMPVSEKETVTVSILKDTSNNNICFSTDAVFAFTFIGTGPADVGSNLSQNVGTTDNVPSTFTNPQGKTCYTVFTNDNNLIKDVLLNIVTDTAYASQCVNIYALPFSFDYIKTTDGYDPIMKTSVSLGDKKYALTSGKTTALCNSFAYFEVKWNVSIKSYLLNNFKDYTPYSVYSIYLPFYGWYDISGELLQTIQNLSIRYLFDATDGSCSIQISDNGKQIIEQISFDFMTPIPKNTTNIADLDRQSQVTAIRILGTGISALASFATGNIAGMISAGATMLEAGLHKEDTIAYQSAQIQANAVNQSTFNSSVGSAVGAVTNIATDAATFAINAVERGQPINSKSLFLKYFNTPYMLIRIIRKAFMSDSEYTMFRAFRGAPLYSVRGLSVMNGYTKIQDIHLDLINCTESEREELNNLLKRGVIF